MYVCVSLYECLCVRVSVQVKRGSCSATIWNVGLGLPEFQNKNIMPLPKRELFIASMQPPNSRNDWCNSVRECLYVRKRE